MVFQLYKAERNGNITTKNHNHFCKNGPLFLRHCCLASLFFLSPILCTSTNSPAASVIYWLVMTSYFLLYVRFSIRRLRQNISKYRVRARVCMLMWHPLLRGKPYFSFNFSLYIPFNTWCIHMVSKIGLVIFNLFMYYIFQCVSLGVHNFFLVFFSRKGGEFFVRIFPHDVSFSLHVWYFFLFHTLSFN